MASTIEVSDGGERLAFTFEDLMRYHGPGSPGGVAHGFKVMERAFAVLAPDGPPERREIVVESAFGGPGARDAFELVTRAVTGERFHLRPELGLPERGLARERFVFRVRCRDREVTLAVREGFVSDEFITLARTERDAAQEERLTRLKGEMATRVMGAEASAVYEVIEGPSGG